MPKIVALCGGVGGAKLVSGLAYLLDPGELAVVVNTGDDFEHLGLLICPDLDTVTYTLAGIENPQFGWGRADESHRVLDELGRLGGDTWFRLGDLDIALHLLRRDMRDRGLSLTDVTRGLCRRFGIAHTVLPMTDAPVRTIVQTAEGALAFQDYFVRRRCAPRVTGFRFEGIARAKPTADVMTALSGEDLRGIIICPSNPYVSVGPILALPGMREALRAARVPVLAVSPIVGGRALKGPAAKMMAELGADVSSLGIAEHYGDLIDALVLDEEDRATAAPFASGGVRFFVTNTVMKDANTRQALARDCLSFIDALSSPR